MINGLLNGLAVYGFLVYIFKFGINVYALTACIIVGILVDILN